MDASEVLESIKVRLTRNVGQVLTAELSRGLFESIAGDVLQVRPPKPPRLVNFARDVVPSSWIDGTTIVMTAQCSIVEMLGRGLVRLHEQHWEETEAHRNHVQLRPNYESMQQAIDDGRARLFSAIDRDRNPSDDMVGNFFCYLFRSTHTGEIVATEDTLFVEKAYRRVVGDRFIRYVLDSLRKAGVKELRISTKVSNSAGELFRRRYKFKHVANEYVRRLDQE